MNDTQEEHFGMHLKVSNFLGVNAAELVGNPACAAFKVKLDGRIASEVAQDVIANTDNKGYTTALNTARTNLEDSVIHVSTGLTGYYRVPLDDDMLEKVNQEKNFYRQASKAELNTQSEIIHQIADPVKLLLGTNDVLAADVDGLNTRRLAFLALYSVPKEKIGDGKAARKELVRLFALTNQELDGELDDLMAVKESTNPVLFSKYESARAIDNMGGGSGTDGYDLKTLTIPPMGSLVVPLGAGPIPAAAQIYIRSVQGTMRICTTNLPASPCISGYLAEQGITYNGPVTGLGLDLTLTALQVTNLSDDTDGILRIGLKIEE